MSWFCFSNSGRLGEQFGDGFAALADKTAGKILREEGIDFRGIQDAFMREKGIDYFENSRRATYVQQQYAIDNPLKFKGYGSRCWGITASDGPGPDIIKVDGIERQFFGYLARGVP